MINKLIVVAMSGGVDSSVAAALLKRQGHEVIGVYLNLWVEPQPADGFCLPRQNRCCSVEALEDARRVAQLLKIPFYALNYEERFKSAVVDYFLAEHTKCFTPNPCIVCNQKVKFGYLLNYSLQIGASYLATGHYVRLKKVGSSCRIYRGVDLGKDQSYMLWTLSQKQLSHLMFPLGQMTKGEVRELAKEMSLPVSEKKDSQEICFVSSKDHRDFLCQHLGDKIKPGEVVNSRGEVIGEHQGLPLYTIGQRKGFDVKSTIPMYTIGYKPRRNQLVVGRGEESEKVSFKVRGVNWLSGKAPDFPLFCQIQTRYRGDLIEGRIECGGKETVVNLSEPSRYVTPGQSAVFYSGSQLLGGGVIAGGS